MLNECYELDNGVKIPKLGLGTWLIDNEKVVDVVKDAFEAGYRHIDTAQAYENEEGVGKAIRESGIAHEELFVTSHIEVPGENTSNEWLEVVNDEEYNKLK